MTSLLARHLDDALRARLGTRVTPAGARLEDVIRSGLRDPRSTIGLYAQDAECYRVFGELFAPVLADLRPGKRSLDAGGIYPANVVSTRIRIARNLAGFPFPARMTDAQRLEVEARIVRACGALAALFPGQVTRIADKPHAAFAADDPFMTAAGIHDGWPVGRSVFNTDDSRIAIWINEEDHLRVAVVVPGANLATCEERMARAMTCLSSHLDFSVDADIGHLTSCPSNAGSGMRVSYRVRMRAGTAQDRAIQRLQQDGVIDVRGPAGEHARSDAGIADIGLRCRVGVTPAQMHAAMLALLKPSVGTRQRRVAAMI